MDPHTADVHVGEVRLRTLRTGSGRQPIVLFAHGITDSGACWSRLAQALSPDHDLVMYDARGHGESEWTGTYTFADHVGDLIALLDELRLPPVVLMGHSMGGAHVAAVASAAPERVCALVLEDPHWPGVPEDWTADDINTWTADVAADSRRSLEDMVARGRQANPRWADVDLEPWARAKLTVDPSVTSWVSSSAGIDGWRAVLTDVTCPALLFVGDSTVDDNVTVREAEAREAQTLCPALEVVHVPGAGHSIRRDRFDLVLPAVREFLSRRVAN